MSFDLVVRNGEARAEAAPVIQRLYHPPGFTDRVLALVRAWGAVEVSEWCLEVARSGQLALIKVADVLEVRNIPSRLLKRIANLLPREQLRDSWNGRPELRVFLRVASRIGAALFDAFIVPKTREDERVSVYAAYLPLYPPHLLKWAVEELTWRSAKPEGVGVVQRGRSYYLMLYWD
jgi:hypothetical protein